MSNAKEKDTEKSKSAQEDNKGGSVKTDPGTKNTTDPQKNMKGPLSSLMHNVGDGFEDDDAEDESKNKKKQ